MPPETIDTAAAKQLVDARAIQSASIVGRPGGWSVILELGSIQKILAAQRSKNVRVWRSLDRCVAFMRDDLGLAKIYQLDASHYKPDGAVRKTRADASVRLKRAHDAAAHDEWFRAQVEEGLRDVDAGRVITEAAHDQHWDKRRAALQKRIGVPKRKA